jgi:uncharacterized membrane protein
MSDEKTVIILVASWMAGLALLMFLFVKRVNKPSVIVIDRRKKPRHMIKPYMRLCPQHVATHLKVQKVAYLDSATCEICNKEGKKV